VDMRTTTAALVALAAMVFDEKIESRLNALTAEGGELGVLNLRKN